MKKCSSVTVIIPAYNQANFIALTLDSLFSQTRLPDEIIVVNDGSTDDTLEVLSKYGNSLRIINQANKGLSGARNSGLNLATGDAIMFLDSDDLLAPNSVQHLLDALDQLPDISAVYCDALLMDEAGKVLGSHAQFHKVPRPSGYIFSEIALHNLFPVHAAMIRRADLGNMRFDETLKRGLEDFDFWIRFSAQHKLHYLPEPLAYYRLHTSSMTQAAPRRMAESEIEVQARVFEMPEFASLSPRQRARIYCSHGVKNAMIGLLPKTKECFWTAIRIAPTYPTGYVLMLSSLLGLPGLRTVISLRRRMAGIKRLSEILQDIPSKGTQKPV